MRGHDHNGKGSEQIFEFPSHPNFNDKNFSIQAVFDVDKENGLTLTEIAENSTIEEIITSTGCEFEVSPDLKKMGQIDV